MEGSPGDQLALPFLPTELGQVGCHVWSEVQVVRAQKNPGCRQLRGLLEQIAQAGLIISIGSHLGDPGAQGVGRQVGFPNHKVGQLKLRPMIFNGTGLGIDGADSRRQREGRRVHTNRPGAARMASVCVLFRLRCDESADTV